MICYFNIVRFQTYILFWYLSSFIFFLFPFFLLRNYLVSSKRFYVLFDTMLLCWLAEPAEYDRMRRKDLSSRRLTMNGNQPTYDLENVNQRSESHIPLTDLSNQHKLGLKETVKHTVYQNCHSTSASGNITATWKASVDCLNCFHSVSVILLSQCSTS